MDSDRDRVAALIAVQEGRFPVPLLGDAAIRDLLSSRPRIAMVGASDKPDRPSYEVMEGLLGAGYDVVPVNPRFTAVHGRTCYPSVVDAVRATGPVEVVDVFRRAEACEAVARDAVAAGARVLWLQLGIADEAAGRVAHEAGLDVVMDRCMWVEHQRLAAAGRR